jgi:hypothetical protein
MERKLEGEKAVFFINFYKYFFFVLILYKILFYIDNLIFI